MSQPTPRSPAAFLDLKIQSKTTLQKEIGWPKEPKRAMVCLPAGMTDDLGGDLFQEMLPGILSLPVEMLILGKGAASYGALFTKLTKDYGHRFHIVPDTEDAVAAMFAAADMALFCSAQLPEQELKACLGSGVVPISLPHTLVENYNPVQETGNAFLYESASKWHGFGALVRALETHKFPFDWKTIQRHCLETVSRA